MHDSLRDSKDDKGNGELVRPDLSRLREHLKERIERTHEEAVEVAFTYVIGHVPDSEKQCVVERVADHPQRVQEEHLLPVPAVHQREA